MKNFLLLLCFACFLNTAMSQTLDISISGIRNTKGVIRLEFYTSAQNFDDRKPSFSKTVSKSSMKDGKLSVTYPGIAAGLYGIALLDDENNNHEMDYGVVLPDEGFGFSNYYHTGLSHPTFGQFDFYLKNETKSIQIKIRYM